MTINTNISPYWDDYDQATPDGLTPKEKYNKILFRPGIPLQARELTQLQSILQNQIQSVGDHMFKDGSMVVPGGISVYKGIKYVKLSTLSITYDLDTLVGSDVSETGTTNTATIVHAVDATSSDSITLYINYTAGDSEFSTGSILTATEFTATVGNALAGTDADNGVGFLVSVDDGIYYLRKHFVIVKSATVVASKYTSNPTIDVGFSVLESITTSGEDTSLNDNATGSPNATAPGAHRLTIKTSMIAQVSTSGSVSGDADFALLARIEDGEVIKMTRKSDYNIFEDTLARRTFDESGNYSVNPVIGKMIAPSSTTIAFEVEPLKAYVQGYEIETISKTKVSVTKGTDTEHLADQSRILDFHNVIIIKGSLSSYLPVPGDTLTLKSNGGSSTLGTCTLVSIQTFFQGGAASTDLYRLNVIDVVEATGGLYGLDTGEVHVGGTSWDINQTWLPTPGYGFTSDNFIFKLGKDTLLTLDSKTDPTVTDVFNHEYEVIREMSSAGTVSGTTVSWTLSGTEQFTDSSSLDWTLYSVDATQAFRPNHIAVAISNANQTATITISGQPTGLATLDGSSVKLIAPVTRSGGTTGGHRSKTLTTQTVNLTTASVDFSTYQNLSTYSDIIAISSVIEYDTTASATVRTVTDYFELDNGQRDSHYGIGRVRVKNDNNYVVTPGSNIEVRVTFTYWAHGGSGDFFTVDSYNLADYETIGSFDGVQLRDSVDFRQIKGTTAQHAPRPMSVFSSDLQYYLARIDKVCINAQGGFIVVEGTSAQEPSEPASPKNAMVTNVLSIPPYTFSPSDVKIKHIDNRRFTMRDIGAINNRINRMEYYTALSLLESRANNQQIYDTATGSHSFKTGIIVDAFTNTLASDVDSPEFRASIDRANGLCRPMFIENNIGLSHSSGATKTGQLVTLPYTSTSVISQLQSSGNINVNPFSVFNWTGTLKLSPSSDEWKETERRPSVVIDDDSIYDALVAQLREENAIGTVWDSWTTNWTGTFTNVQSWDTSTGRTRTATWRTGETSRSGVETFIAPSTVLENHGDRVVEVNLLPFMRSRQIVCEVSRCRPLTQIHTFFNGVDVSAYTSLTTAPDTVNGIASKLYAKNNSRFPSTATASPTITTDSAGAKTFYLWIPEGESAGTVEVLVTEDSTNTPTTDTTLTSASANYTSKGILEAMENVTVSTRVPTIQKRNVSDTTSSTQLISTQWTDPLAQSFMIDMDGGCFVTSLDLYFTTEDTSVPVTVQIREMENGYPTQRVVPFSDVTVAPSGISTTGASTFTFDSPVFLQKSVEYAFVILSNSNNYNLRYATIGERDENDVMIQSQPYNGVMFKSANASTWTADQSSDIKFQLNRAEFTTTSTSFVLNSSSLPHVGLSADPLTTDSTTSVVVYHPNHGLSDGDTAELLGAVATAGIPASEINTSHTVSNVRLDTYTIVVTTTATSNGIGGGSNISGRGNVSWNTIYPYVENMVLPDTTMGWTMTSSSVSSGSNAYENDTALSVVINSNHTSLSSKKVLSDLNSTASSINNSISLTGTMTTTKTNLSPVVDLDRASIITVSNRVDRPASTTTTGYNVVDNYENETHVFQGSAQAKYVTKPVKLDEDSTELKIWMDIHQPTKTYVSVYVKFGSSVTDMDDNIAWTLIDPDSAVNRSNLNQFTGNGVIPNTDNPGEFAEVGFSKSLGANTTFSVFAIKVVFESEDTSRVPMIRNFRAIAVV